MTWRRPVRIALGILLLALLAWAVTWGLERVVTPRPQVTLSTAAGRAPDAGVPHITATLFYGSEDGQALVPVRREVPLAEGNLLQGREILLTQLQPAPAPYISVIPEGTTLRAFYVAANGEAFVDLSPEVSSRHPGGSFTELLTVYAIVNAITANLSSVQRVQILIDGKEADTLAGHIDLRRPLQQDDALVRQQTEAQ
jgi:hypothetical protein